MASALQRLLLIAYREEALQILERRYNAYIQRLLEQKSLIAHHIRQQFDEQINNVHIKDQLQPQYHQIEVVEPMDDSVNNQSADTTSIQPEPEDDDDEDDDMNVNATHNDSESIDDQQNESSNDQETMQPNGDKQEAEQHKVEGNKLMKHKKYKEAMEEYTRAITLDPSNAIFYCNRSAVHCKMRNYEQAAIDSYVHSDHSNRNQMEPVRMHRADLVSVADVQSLIVAEMIK